MGNRFSAIALAIGITALVTAEPAAADNTFAQFTGSWSGNGNITVQDGTRERIRCRGSYATNQSGKTLTLGLRCASDSYKFELQSEITNDSGAITGTWNEVNRKIFGTLSGKATSSHIQATASAVGFTAALSLTARGNNQNVSIKSPGSEISEVTIAMARSGR